MAKLFWPDDKPPGSDAALDEGCLCPVLDNRHGKGMFNEGWIITVGCPVHNPEPPKEEVKL